MLIHMARTVARFRSITKKKYICGSEFGKLLLYEELVRSYLLKGNAVIRNLRARSIPKGFLIRAAEGLGEPSAKIKRPVMYPVLSPQKNFNFFIKGR